MADRKLAGGREMIAEAGKDSSLAALVAANLVALAIAYWSAMSLRELMLVYWIQSVIIGVCAFLRILNLNRFDPSGYSIGRRAAQETTRDKVGTALAFAAYYAVFHCFYLVFLVLFSGDDRQIGSAVGYALCALVFAANHGYSLLRNCRRDRRGRPKIGFMMVLPFARVVPMHVTIVVGGAFIGAHAFLLFAALKILADCVMHTVEHHVLAKGSVLPPSEPSR